MPSANDFNRFSYNPVNIDKPRSLFNMDHSVKFSGNVGDVIPFEVFEIYPGDTLTIDTTKVVRLQPLVAPIMDEVLCDIFYFFCPNRLVWDHWRQFLGENTASAWTPSVEYNVPKIKAPDGGFAVGSVADYLGVPPLTEGYLSAYGVNALPFRAYALICDQWFRSESLMDPVHVHVDDTTRTGVTTDDQVTDIELGGMPFVACRYPDYFSSALPSPQRGNPVSIPLAESVQDLNMPVKLAEIGSDLHKSFPYYPDGTHKANGRNALHFSKISADAGELRPNYTNRVITDIGTNDTYNVLYQSGKVSESETHPAGVPFTHMSMSISPSSMDAYSTQGYQFLFPSNQYVELEGSSIREMLGSITINDLRTAFAIQRYLETSARYGGRYIEFIRAFFGIESPDARLQRTEYLGGSRLSLNINSVEQTSATQSTGTPLGNVAGLSVTADSNSDFTKSFTEHGYVIGVCVLRYHHSYGQGLERHFLYDDKYDYYVPTFANLGEMPVYRTEIHASKAKIPFGYQEAYAWLRFKNNRVAGEMRPSVPNSLAYWNLADDYINDDGPFLSADWIREDKTNLDRCLAVTSAVAHQAIFDFYVKTECARVLPFYSIPGLVDHN